MTDTATTMTLQLRNTPLKVSAFSSLLRSMQAAIRDTVGGPLLLDEYSQQHGPFLVTSIIDNSDDNVTLALWFADGDDQPLWDITHTVFERFMRAIEVALSRGDQRTFWGAPATGLVLGQGDSRMTRFIANLRTFGSATMTYRDCTLELQNGAINLQRD